ncbi:MAG: hypothetical protein ACK2TV_01855 [Anaerolineales bacterium]
MTRNLNKNESLLWNTLTIFTIILFIGTLLVIMASCNVFHDDLIGNPTETAPFIKQPEPHEPLVQGTITGLAADELFTLLILGVGSERGTGHGNGPWEAVISNARDGERYIVTVEVSGYISTPESYTIIVKEKIAYLVKNEQITSEEAKNLDFHFTSLATPTHE